MCRPKSRSRVRIGLLVVCLLAAAAGCNRSSGERPNAVFVLGVEDRASGVPKGVRFDQQHSRKYLSEALAASKTMTEVEERVPGAFRAELVIELASERESERDGSVGVYRAVQVEIHVHRLLDDEREWLSAQGKAFLVQQADEEDRNEGFDRVLALAIAKAVEYLDLQLEARQLDADQIERRLKDERAEDRLYVLRSLRGRKMPELIPAVIGMLKDTDDDVVLEAVGVLVDQRDERAVLPLIRMSQTRDPIFQLQIITAMAELGGDVARGYLFTLAAGHGSAEVRQRAKEGLERIREAEERAGQDPGEHAVATPRPLEPQDDLRQRGAK